MYTEASSEFNKAKSSNFEFFVSVFAVAPGSVLPETEFGQSLYQKGYLRKVLKLEIGELTIVLPSSLVAVIL